MKRSFFALIAIGALFVLALLPRRFEAPESTKRAVPPGQPAQPETAPSVGPSPEQTPKKPAPTPRPKPRSTPRPVRTPPPPRPKPTPDPIPWVLKSKDRWPREVTLTEPAIIPIGAKDATVLRVPEGSLLKVVSIEPEMMSVSFEEQSFRVPLDATDLAARAGRQRDSTEGATARDKPVKPAPAPGQDNASSSGKKPGRLVDALILGNPWSERAHKVSSGAGGVFLNTPGPFQPQALPNSRGYAVAFVMEIDGERSNHISVLFPFPALSVPSRIELFVDGHAVGTLHAGESDPAQSLEVQPWKGVFRSAIELPLDITKGKTSIPFELRIPARAFQYPARFFQGGGGLEITNPSGVRLFVHTDPDLVLPHQ